MSPHHIAQRDENRATCQSFAKDDMVMAVALESEWTRLRPIVQVLAIGALR